MRTKLLCALTILCAAQCADAQQYPGYGYYANQQQYPGYGYYGNQQQYPGYGYNANYQQFASSGQQATGPFATNAFSQSGTSTGDAAAYQAAQYYGAYPYNGNYPGNNYGGYYPYGYSPATTAAPGPQAGADTPLAGQPQSAPPADSPVAQQPYVNMPMQPGMPLTAADRAGDDRYDQAGRDEDAFHRPTNEKFYASAEYTMGWFNPQRSAGPLVTTGSALDVSPGALGQPGTAVLFGDRNIDYGMFSGIRGDVGVFLDSCDHISVDASGLYLFPNDVRYKLASDGAGNPLITRPVINATNGQQIAYADAIPGLIAGGISIDSRSELLGAELNATYHAYCGNHLQVEGLFGFRYTRLAESLTIQDQFSPLTSNVLTFLGAPVSPPDTMADEDRFRTTNDFYGLQLGGKLRWESDWCSLTAFGKAGLGATDQQVNISGSTTLFTPTGNQAASGGILALPTNIGQHDRTVLGFVSELGATFGVNVCKHLELTATYSILYWNQVVRPSAQIDRNVNVNLVPSDAAFGTASGSPQPAFSFNQEAFWVQTLNFGVVLHY
jgi:hypothetical protein